MGGDQIVSLLFSFERTMMEKQGGKRGLGFFSLPGETEHEGIKGVYHSEWQGRSGFGGLLGLDVSRLLN